jgi:2-dehydropantoate 2-reductase
MRVVVYGVGAVGGVLAAALTRAGTEVIGIARGAQLDAIRESGLLVRSPNEDFAARFDCAASPSEITFRSDDVIFLTMKTQDTEGALDQLRASGVRDQAIFCFQNGVANERMALRRFSNIHGVTVMMPCSYLQAGRVSVRAAPRFGLFDIGQYPSRSDETDAAVASRLEAANFGAFVLNDVMQSKYGKLLLNLGNMIEAAVGPGVDSRALRDRVRKEGEAVLRAAGIKWLDVGASDPRRDAMMRTTEVPGEDRSGGSTVQSLNRSTGRVETDFLNGEIALIARMAGAKAPLNAALADLGAQLAREGQGAGSMTLDQLNALLT